MSSKEVMSSEKVGTDYGNWVPAAMMQWVIWII